SYHPSISPFPTTSITSTSVPAKRRRKLSSNQERTRSSWSWGTRITFRTIRRSCRPAFESWWRSRNFREQPSRRPGSTSERKEELADLNQPAHFGLHEGDSMGHSRHVGRVGPLASCPLCSDSDQTGASRQCAALCHKRS